MTVDVGETIGLMEQLTVRRRNRLKQHFTLTSNVIIFGYRSLSEAEKLTYQAVDSFDWPDGSGERKGYAYPSIATLARLRGVSERSIQRHLESLERVGLLTREVRPGRPSLLWIEEPSRAEQQAYFALLQGVTRMSPLTQMSPPGGDTDVTPYKEEEREKKTKSLTTVRPVRTHRQRGEEGSAPLGAEIKARREWLAGEMLSVLKDQHSLGYYRKVAVTAPEHQIFEALSEVKQASREGRVRTNKAALFTALMHRSVE